MFYVLYPFVTYLLTLSRICTGRSDMAVNAGFDIPFHLAAVWRVAQSCKELHDVRLPLETLTSELMASSKSIQWNGKHESTDSRDLMSCSVKMSTETLVPVW
jgi:hypothetical protein